MKSKLMVIFAVVVAVMLSATTLVIAQDTHTQRTVVDNNQGWTSGCSSINPNDCSQNVCNNWPINFECSKREHIGNRGCGTHGFNACTGYCASDMAGTGVEVRKFPCPSGKCATAVRCQPLPRAENPIAPALDIIETLVHSQI